MRKPILKPLWSNVHQRIQIDGIEVISSLCCRYQVLYALLPSVVMKGLSDRQVILERFLGVVCALEISAFGTSTIREEHPKDLLSLPLSASPIETS